MIGQNLKGRYGIDAEFYADKLGTAYKATDNQDGTPVVVLVLDEQVSTGGDEVSALLAAAGIVRELDSPTLVPTTASGITDDGKVFLVHPLPDAVPLKSLVKGGLPIEQVVDITRQIAAGASVASEAGLQHLDLSGYSVLVTVLSDGGQVARVTRHGYQSLLPLYSTAKKNLPFYGTAEYMAPELCSGKGADPRSDIYSLGILMYEMVVGKCPFVSNNVQTVLKRQIFEKPLPLHLLKRGLAGINEFEKIVFQALQKMPARRQESMAQLVEQLDAFRMEFLAEADLTPLPAAGWPEIGGVEESAAPVPEAAAEEAERRPAETMMFSGISSEQVMAATMTEPDASAAAEEAGAEEVETLKMPFAAAEKVVQEAIAEQTADQIEEDDPAKKTLMMAPIPAAAAEAAAAAKPVVDTAAATPASEAGAAAGPDDDWFVDSGHDLAGKEQPPQSWGEHKSGSNTKFYVMIGIIAVLIVVLIVVVMSRNKTTEPAKDETEKAQLDPAMKRQLEQEKKAKDSRKAQEEKARKIREELEAEKAAKEQIASEAAATKAADAAAAAEAKAVHDAKRAELTDRFLAVRTKGQGLRNQLSERRGKWTGDGAEAKIVEIDQAIVSLDRIIAPEKMKKLANDMGGDTLGTVEDRVQRLEGQIAAFKVRADRLLVEAAPATTEISEEAAAKLAEEAAAKKAAEEAAVGALTEEEAAKKAAEEAAAAELAAEEAAKKAAADAAAATAAEEAAAAKAAEEAAAAKAAEEAAAAKAAEEAAAAKAAEEAAAKKAADAAAAKKAAEAAAAKKAADAAAAKNDGGTAAAAKKAAEAAAKKKAAEAAAKKKAAEAAAAKKAAEEAAAKKAAEEAAAKNAGDADQGKALMKDGISAYKKGQWGESITIFEKAKAAGGNAGLADKYITKAKAKQAEAKTKAADDAAAKKAADAAAAAKAAEAAAAKKAADDAAAKKAADAAAAKKAADDAAAKKAADAAAAKKAADAAAAKKAADAAAAKKAADAAAAKKAADAAAAKKAGSGKDAEKAKKYMKLGISAYKKGSHALAIKYFEKAKGYADDGALAEKWIDKAAKAQSGN
jgi:hypothetical protein